MDILSKIDAKTETGNQFKKSSKYELLPRTRRLCEFEAPDTNFNIYSLTPVPSGDAVWVCCKNSKFVTLIDKVGTVLRQVEYPILVNGIDIALGTRNIWTSGAGGCVMECSQSGEPILRFSTGKTILCLCVTQNNKIIIGMCGKLVRYDFDGNVILTSDFTNDLLVDTANPLTGSASAGPPFLTKYGETLAALDVFLAGKTGTLKPASKQEVFHSDSSTVDEYVGPNTEKSPNNAKRNAFSEKYPEQFDSVLKGDSEVGNLVPEVHATSSTEQRNVKDNTSYRTEKKSDNRTRPLVCTPHVVRECPVTNNIAVVDLDRVGDGGNGSRPFILILNSQFKKERQCVFPIRYLINDLIYDSVGNIVVIDSFGCVLLLSGIGILLRKLFRPDVAVHPYVLGVDKETNLLWTVFKDFRDRSNVKLLKYCKGGHFKSSWSRYSTSNIYISTRM